MIKKGKKYPKYIKRTEQVFGINTE